MLASKIQWPVGRGYFNLTALPQPLAAQADYSNTKALGGLLYTEYVFAFEIAAVILLVAIIAAISLTLAVAWELGKSRLLSMIH